MDRETLLQFPVEPSDNASTHWERWVHHFGNYLMAKDIAGDRQKEALLLHFAGEEVFDLSKALGVVDGNTYAATKIKLDGYFAQKQNVRNICIPTGKSAIW